MRSKSEKNKKHFLPLTMAGTPFGATAR
jgi:hypothetical protein